MTDKKNKKNCVCPYCDEEISAMPTHVCKPCQVELHRCVKCMVVVDRDAKVCPKCGQPL